MYKTLRPHSSKNVFFNDNQPRHPFLNSSSFRLKSLSLEEKNQLINLKSTPNSPQRKLPVASNLDSVLKFANWKTKVPKYGLYEMWFTHGRGFANSKNRPKVTNPRGTFFFHLFFSCFPSKGNNFGILPHGAALRHHSTLKELVLEDGGNFLSDQLVTWY